MIRKRSSQKYLFTRPNTTHRSNRKFIFRCDRLGQTANFVTDVARAWQLAEDMYTQNPSESIALQCRYALIITSLNSQAINIPAELIAALVKEQLWTPAQGLVFKMTIPVHQP